jgi:hypothetical protein
MLLIPAIPVGVFSVAAVTAPCTDVVAAAPGAPKKAERQLIFYTLSLNCMLGRWSKPRRRQHSNCAGLPTAAEDTAMLKRLNDIASFPDEDKKHILYTLDALIKNVKLKAI